MLTLVLDEKRVTVKYPSRKSVCLEKVEFFSMFVYLFLKGSQSVINEILSLTEKLAA